ncbi:MAG: efflux RND transporter periplasmic adaptor subunit [Syntrophales bacterium]|nr:efflux RND transporter periplasmic adaptor subunit [Syntrophales bacterium]
MKFGNNIFLPVIIPLLGITFMLAGCGQNAPSGGPPPGGAPEVAVVTVTPERVDLATELPGRTSAYLVAEVRPQVGGIIQERLFTEGQDVKAGEILYKINPATYQAASASAKASLARAEANLAPVRLKAQRYGELVVIKAVSRQDHDEAVAMVKQVEAEIEVQKAAVENARINLAYTSITAPISGRIGKSNLTVGALATANQGNPLSMIQQIDPLYVDVTQSSSDLLRLRRNIENGQIKRGGVNQARVRLILEDGTPYPLMGVLKFSDITVDQGTGSVTLRTVFPNPKHVLLPGMYVRAILDEGVNERAILVPQQGVTRDQKGNAVAMTVDGGGKVVPRILKINRSLGERWLVSEGLNPGDRVIVEGLQRVGPGATVNAVPFVAKPPAPAGAASAAPAAK